MSARSFPKQSSSQKQLFWQTAKFQVIVTTQMKGHIKQRLCTFCFAVTLSLSITECVSLNKQRRTTQQLFCQILTVCTPLQQVINRLAKGGQCTLSLWILLYMFAQWCPVIPFLTGPRCDSLCHPAMSAEHLLLSWGKMVAALTPA